MLIDVGHSYGGMVITDAGNDGKVGGLVYIAAFEPEKGESLFQLARPHAGAERPARCRHGDRRRLSPSRFERIRGCVCGRRRQDEAGFLAHSQVFAAKAAFAAEAAEPAGSTSRVGR